MGPCYCFFPELFKTMHLTIHLPPRQQQLDFHRKRWAEVLQDRGLADLPYRIETNEHGQLLMTPPASGGHSTRQSRILLMLDRLLGGQSLAECPILTIAGVKAADVGWYSETRFAQVAGQDAFEIAPEICVEVLSPSNTHSEMQIKRQLYFDAGAKEVWICEQDGAMSFYLLTQPDSAQAKSVLCPDFPGHF
jgi:Uma2 family endonuclease